MTVGQSDPHDESDPGDAPGRADDRGPVDEPDPGEVPDVSVLVVDNYDSFAYNLVQYVGELAGEVAVCRNDAIDLADVRRLDPDAVVISPGPGRPEDAGVSTALFEEPELPILGVCLGHQAMCAAYGATVGSAPAVVHGKPSVVAHDGAGLYRGLPERLRVGRYHSLAVPRAALPDDLVETAWTVVEERTPGTPAGDGASEAAGASPEPSESRSDDAPGAGHGERSVLMGVRHRERPHYGVQFHPESILTGAADDPESVASLALGKRLVARFCELAAAHGGESDEVDHGADGDAPPASDDRPTAGDRP